VWDVRLSDTSVAHRSNMQWARAGKRMLGTHFGERMRRSLSLNDLLLHGEKSPVDPDADGAHRLSPEPTTPASPSKFAQLLCGHDPLRSLLGDLADRGAPGGGDGKSFSPYAATSGEAVAWPIELDAPADYTPIASAVPSIRDSRRPAAPVSPEFAPTAPSAAPSARASAPPSPGAAAGGSATDGKRRCQFHRGRLLLAQLGLLQNPNNMMLLEPSERLQRALSSLDQHRPERECHRIGVLCASLHTQAACAACAAVIARR
jgi:hypothetical protein